MNKKLLRKKLALMLANLKKKRPFYTEVEYLESTGTQYIDTGYEMSAGKTMTFNGNIMWTQSNGIANFFYGYRSVNSATAEGDMRAFFVYGQSSGGSTGRLAIRYGAKVDNSTSILSLNQRYNLSFDGINLKVNGTNYVTLTGAYETPVYKSMWLFNCNCTGYYRADVSTFSGRIYNWQIFEDGVLVRDLIPVLGWDGKGYMYDKVSGQLFGNAGTGDFVMGRQIHPVEYLESTGTQYINTGIKNKSALRIEAKFNQQQIESRYAWVFGGRDASVRGGGFGFGYNSESVYISDYFDDRQISTITAVLNTDVVVDKNKNVCKITTNNTTTTLTNVNSASSGDYNITLFALNNAGTVSDFSTLRLFYDKIWDNGTLVRDYIPAIDSEGRGFMFDRVTHTIYDNAGQGQFKYPAREVEYIKNNGSNTYLSLTGFYPTPDWDIECEVMGRTWGFIDSFNSLNIMGCGSSAATDSYTLTIAQGDVGATTPTCRRGGAGVRKVGCDLNVKYKIISTETSITWNGEAGTFLSQPTGNTATTNPITLFRNPLSTAIGTMNIYSFVVKSHQTGNKILDLVPVLMNGSAGMLDKVNNVMYTNQGTGSWTLGKIVEPEYE